MTLSEEELLLLSAFMYTDISVNSKGETVHNAIKDYIDNPNKISELELSGDLKNEPEHALEILKAMDENKNISSLRIDATTDEKHGSIRAACFVDKEGQATVAFRGTGGSYRQWNNNFEAYGDIANDTQVDSAEFINSLPYDSIDVTGHSNGANQAMYNAIVYPDKIRRCICFEGEGVSQEFINDDDNLDKILKNSWKIKNICADNDFNNGILIDISGETVYLPSNNNLLFGVFSHGTYGLWKTNKENGNFDKMGNFKASSYVDRSWYCYAITGLTASLSSLSNVPIVGSCLELVADMIGITVGLVMDHTWDSAKLALRDAIKSLSEFALGLFGDPKNTVLSAVKALNNILDVVSYSLSKRYAEENPYIVIDTDKMKNYAGQLSALSSRSKSLDRRMNSLYWNLGIDWDKIANLGRLLKAEVVLDFAGRLDKCASYLNETASDFEKAEREIVGMI